MKILHVIPSMSPLRGGPVFAMRAMSKGLNQCGIEVHIATTDDNGSSHLDVPLGRSVMKDDGVIYWYFRRQTSFYTVSWPLMRWLARNVFNYDLLHCHGLFSFPTLPAAWYASQMGRPYIVRPLGTLNQWGMQQRRSVLKKLSFHLIESQILRRASVVHYTSAQERIEAQMLGVVRPSVILPLGIELASFQELAPAELFLARFPGIEGRFIIFFFSRLDKKKGLDLLIPAFAKAHRQKRELILVVAGNGEPLYIDQLQTLTRQYGIEDSIIWTGFLRGKEKLAAFAAADLFVLPSYSENFGIAVVEAMAAGLPVIISDKVGIWREVQKAKAGLIVPCQVSELASAMQKLTSNSRMRQEMSKSARRLAQEQFSVDVMTHSLVQLYRDLIGNQKKRK